MCFNDRLIMIISFSIGTKDYIVFIKIEKKYFVLL